MECFVHTHNLSWGKPNCGMVDASLIFYNVLHINKYLHRCLLEIRGTRFIQCKLLISTTLMRLLSLWLQLKMVQKCQVVPDVGRVTLVAVTFPSSRKTAAC